MLYRDENIAISAREYRDDAEMFDLAPVSLWLEDYSGIKTLLDEIHQLTVALIRGHVQHQKRKAGRP